MDRYMHGGEDMEEQERRAGGSKGVYRDIEGVGRGGGREEVFWGREVWVRGHITHSVRMLVLLVRHVRELQCGVSKADGLGQEVRRCVGRECLEDASGSAQDL